MVDVARLAPRAANYSLTLKVDVTFDDSTEDEPSCVAYGIQSVFLIKQLQRQLPELRPIVLVLKRLLALWKLHNPFTGSSATHLKAVSAPTP